MVVDVCKKFGFTDVFLVSDLKEIIAKADKFSSFLNGVSPELSNLLTRNEYLNGSLHKKYQNYINQRLTKRNKLSLEKKV